MKRTFAVLAICGAATATHADIHVTFLPEFSFPPSSFLGAPLTPAPFDSRLFEDVLSRPDGLGGEISFSDPLSCRQIGEGWAAWSHEYTGSVYYTNGLTDITVTFAPGTKVAYLYVDPNPIGVHQMTVIGSDGATTVTRTDGIHGVVGAVGYLFHTDGFLGEVVSVRVVGDVDFAVGEFGTSRVPASGALSVLGLAGLTGRRRR